ncbi:MAG: hypothetical protein DRP35_10900 [Candidatus Zixiibacteriota bacterium]|nr:MAG: hypothetical protein DRP35_10900 [candidate division Zixibacteria bacterium]
MAINLREENIKKIQKDDQNQSSNNLHQIKFLGKSMTTDEYEESCRNLHGFFDILASWQKGKSDES